MRRRVFVLATALLAIIPAALGAQPPSTHADNSARLRRFLQEYLRSSDDKTARYLAAFVDLKDDGTKQAIVYFTDQHSCGSGGCSMLILVPQRPSYRVVGSITIAWPPVRVLKTKSHGWHDIAVWVQGGGIQPGYEAVLSYDGRRYPNNPTVPPARAASQKPKGNTVIPALSKGVPVY